YSVASAGDVNGDGFDDLTIGSFAYHTTPGRGGGEGKGQDYVTVGHPAGFDADINLADLKNPVGFNIPGLNKLELSGFAVSSAGDINGDGLADFTIGNHAEHTDVDSVSYVVFGHEPDTAVNRTGTDASQNLVGGAFNDTLRGLGGDDKLYGHAGAD